MPLVSFEQDPTGPPGSGVFTDNFGNKRHLYAPDVAASLSGGGDQRLALLGGSRPEPPPGLQPGMVPPTATDAPPPMLAAPGAPPGVGGGPPGYQPDQGQRQGMNDATRDLLSQQTAAAALRSGQPGRGGTKGGFVPAGQTVSITNQGPGVSDEERQKYADADANQRAAIQSRAGIESAGKEKEADVFAQAAADDMAQREHAERKRQAISDMWEQDKTDLASAKAELNQAQKDFDPNRLMTQNTAVGIGGAIFRAMGAYAQALGRLPNNSAGDVIDSFIQRDVAKQRQQIESSKGKVDNALQALHEHFGDMRLAELALTDLQHSWAQNQLRAYAAQTGSQQVMAGANQDLAALDEKNAQREHDFAKESYGLRSTQVHSTFVQPRGPAGPPTVDQALDRERKQADIEKTRAETDALRNKGTQGKAPGWRIQANVVAGNNALHVIDDSLNTMGVKQGKDGEYETPGYLARKGTQLGLAGQSALGTEDARKLAVNKEIMAGEVSKLASGGAATEGQLAEMHKLLDSNDPASLVQLRKLVKGFIRNNQNAATLAQPGFDASEVPGAEDYEGEK